MKRIFVIVLLVLVSLPCFGFASEAFLFRGILTWGMPKEEVATLLEEDGLVLSQAFEDGNEAYYADVPVGDYVAEYLWLKCGDDGLETLTYFLPMLAPGKFEEAYNIYRDLLEGLTRVYGNPIERDLSRAAWDTPAVEVSLWIDDDTDGNGASRCTILYRRPKELNTQGF